MTNRTRILTVVLEDDYRDDDVEDITNAISQIRGVLSVDINVTDPKEYMAIATAKNEIRKKIWELL